METVRVSFRFRGGEGNEEIANIKLDNQQVMIFGQKNPFEIDNAIDPQDTQDNVYQQTADQVIQAFMEGYNGTIFAYGASASGKTYTMMGPESVTETIMANIDKIPQEIQSQFGIIPRAVNQISHIMDYGTKNKQIQYTMLASYIEIYNDQVNDIMTYPVKKNLKIREFPNLGMVVIGIVQKPITTPREMFECLALGMKNMTISATNLNSRSNRSHTLFFLDLEQKFQSGTIKKSRINLVDLASGEKVSKTGAESQISEETKKINLSLITLGRVIKALIDPKEPFVPFRETKLTIILKESLGGNTKTSLICTASLKQNNIKDTISTLRFAVRARQVVCKPRISIQTQQAFIYEGESED